MTELRGSVPFEAWRREYTDATVAFGEQILSVPWTAHTVKARGLVLATSVGAVLVLVGSKAPTDSVWKQIRETLGADVLLLFIVALLLYALAAFVIGAMNDLERHRLLTARRYEIFERQLAMANEAPARHVAELPAEDAPPPEIGAAERQLAAAKARVRALEDELEGASGERVVGELTRVRSRRDELDDRVSDWRRGRLTASASAMRDLVDYLGAPKHIESVSGDLFARAKRGYQFQTIVELVGPLILGLAVLVRLVVNIVG